jgi:hypothetical protein
LLTAQARVKGRWNEINHILTHSGSNNPFLSGSSSDFTLLGLNLSFFATAVQTNNNEQFLVKYRVKKFIGSAPYKAYVNAREKLKLRNV